jgi:hypothetical protein
MIRIVAWQAIVGCLAIGGVGFLLALFVRAAIGDSWGGAALRGLETLLTASIGGFLAHMTIVLFLCLGTESKSAVTMLAVMFFPPVGLVNLILVAAHHGLTSDSLLWVAVVVGGLVGMYDGLWATQDWKGLGWLAFPMDVTWGIAGNSIGLVLHIINTGRGHHADDKEDTDPPVENRQCAHRYKDGFALKSGYAFSQGAVMSSTSDNKPGTDLYKHEMFHVWQNRLLGPFYWSTYIGWMAVMFVPSLIAGIWLDLGNAILWWNYFNNPYEAMAFVENGPIRDNLAPKDSDGKIDGVYSWPTGLIIFLGIIVLPGIAISLGVLAKHFGVFG